MNGNTQRTSAQLRADARNTLFRQLHGCGIEHYGNIAAKYDAITSEEAKLLLTISSCINKLKEQQFDNSKELGFYPRRRCAYCKNVARWKRTNLTFGIITPYVCSKHKHAIECDELEHGYSDEDKTKFIEINPYE